MKRHVIQDSRDPLVLSARDSIVRHLPAGTGLAIAQAIYDFTRDAIRYTPDPPGLDTLKPAPWVISEYKDGRRTPADCASQTVLIGTLARSLDIPIRFRVIGSAYPENLYHISPELWIRAWVNLDVTAETAEQDEIRKNARLGYAAPEEIIKYYML